MKRHLITKELEQELMLYDVEGDEIHILNSSAQLIYKLYKQGKSFDEIEEAVISYFHLDKHPSIRTDIKSCLEDLSQKGLIKRNSRER